MDEEIIHCLSSVPSGHAYGSVAAADNATCEVGVLVSCQYSDDNGRINPTLEITDSGTGIEYNRTYDPSSGYTKLIFQHSNISAANLTLTVRRRATLP